MAEKDALPVSISIMKTFRLREVSAGWSMGLLMLTTKALFTPAPPV